VVDLQSYSSVVAYAHLADKNLFSDVLRTKITNAIIGIPTGSDNNIITTNDVGLNQIFQDFNVYYYQPIAFQWYTIACNCDNYLLKAALDNYSSVTNKTEYISRTYLSTSKFSSNRFLITPNPFSSTFTIDNQRFISEYAIFDISGKQIIKTNSKPELDNQTENLKTGIYVLELKSLNGEVVHHKIAKK
jgi:hypothetical protein